MPNLAYKFTVGIISYSCIQVKAESQKFWYNASMKKRRHTEKLDERAYEFVSGLLASGELKPGQKLSEPSLASACGVSRTPMREAVRRLIAEGVLNQIPKSGTYVCGFGAKDICDAYDIRSAIESAMLERAVPRLTKHDLSKLAGNCERMHKAILAMKRAKMPIMTGKPETEFLAEDVAFHLLFLRASGNALAEKIIANTYRRNQFFGTHSHQRTLLHVSLAWRFHCEILKACRAGDAAAAVYWLKTHIARSKRDALMPLSRM